MDWRALWRTFKRPFIIALVIFFALLLNNLITSEERSIVRVDGGTLGVAYHISYIDNKERNFKHAIDSLLAVIHGSLASYIDTSAVARINNLNDTARTIPVDNHFRQLFRQTKQLHQETNGFFEPSLNIIKDNSPFRSGAYSSTTDSLPLNGAFHHFSFVETNGKIAVKKRYPKARLNFDLIAKGYAVDKVANLLEANGIAHYLIDIGGQIRAQGTNQFHEPWQAGLTKSFKHDTSLRGNEFQFVLKLQNEALATDRSSRLQEPFSYGIDSHQLGQQNSSVLLSTTIICDRSSAHAQGWAIAYNAMGFPESWHHVRNQDRLSAYFIYIDSASGALETKHTQDLSQRFVESLKGENL